jgi:hypothetical protein
MNSPNWREIEKKYILKISKANLRRLVNQLRNKTEVPTDYLEASTLDFYWNGKTPDQFLRLRHSRGRDGEGKRTLKELTAKSKDKKTNVDRLEVNAPAEELRLLRKALTVALGEPTCRLFKKEHVFWMKDRTVISLCQIKKNLYLEIEGSSRSRLSKWFRFFSKLSIPFTLQPEPRSLYEIFKAA